MEGRDQFVLEIEDTILYPTAVFYRALKQQPSDVRRSLGMKRLGLLVEQLHPYEELLCLDASSDSVSTDDFTVRADFNAPKPLPDTIRQRTIRVEAAALGEDVGLIIQKQGYQQDTINSVYGLLKKLQSEFGEQRKRAIGAYCRKVGIFDSGEETDQDDSDNRGDDHPFRQFDSNGSDHTIPDVSKL